MKKKIGVLTLPTLTNYGGILQAYALVFSLRKLGFDAWLINRRWNSEGNNVAHKIKKVFYHLIVIRKFDRFVNKYIIPKTEVIDTRSKMDSVRNMGFDGYVVGSDQVWRVKNVRGADYNFFLDFSKDDDVRRISYAASFGVDYWDDNQNGARSIEEVKPLLQKFDAISVREDSGVKVCKECFDVDAVHVLDPTLLLDKAEYIQSFSLKDKQKKYLAVYMLDMTTEKRQLIRKVSKELGLSVKYINKPSVIWNWLPSSLSAMVKPGVRRWMQSIMEAEYVLTDSFHGMAFSIIFEKQFLVVGNKRRGLARFTSLLGELGITERLIVNDLNPEKIFERINYLDISERKHKKQQLSVKFLTDTLYQ